VRVRWIRKYLQVFELGFQTALEYRANFALSLLSAAYPIIIQTYLWTAIYANSTQAVVYGYTYRQMIAYTFLAGLVSRIVRTGFEYDIMDDVKSGKFSKFQVQPLGYFPYRLSAFLGQKLPNLAMILVIMVIVLVVLSAFWGVTLGLFNLVSFLLSLGLAVILNFLIFYCFSAVAFWIIEIGFLFEGIRIVTILLSGGIFPLEVFGERLVQVFKLLPFQYTISFPINVLNGKVPAGDVVLGLLVQVVWVGVILLLARWLWQQGTQRYVAVGG
jgi:ABC-2 type transport system permease protein